MKKPTIGIIGCGNISGIYLKNLTGVFSEHVELLGCADLIQERAEKATTEYRLPKSYRSTEELLADPEVDIILNITIPGAHFSVCKGALEAGKHVYVEKPLSVTMEEGKQLVDLAKKKDLRIGCAPDTFLGAGIQTCRKLIDDGWIGRPVAATAFMTCHGHESWHPDPEFYYKTGGGPMFDMGPYYLTALVNLLGPAKKVSGSARVTFDRRKITSEPKHGTIIDVDVPTHVAGTVDFVNGAVAAVITSFDVWAAHLPRIEIYGSEGGISVPDPNTFGGPVLFQRYADKEWHEIPLTHGFSENSRGIGIMEMALSIQEKKTHRASGDLAYHVLELMHGFHRASEDESYFHLSTSPQAPDLLPMDFLL